MIELAASSRFIRIVMLAALFVIVALVAMAILSVVSRRANMRVKLQQLRKVPLLANQTQVSLRAGVAESAWARIAQAVEAAGLDLSDTNDARLSKRMRAAGFMSPTAPRVFTLTRLSLLIVLPLAYVVLSYSGGEPPSFLKLYLVGAGLALLGLYLPNIFVQAKADRRSEEIVHGFPDCLDLLLVCVESGLGIEAAMDRVGREMAISHPLVAQLLSVTTLQLRAGSSREDAFRKLAETASVDDIRSFTTLIIQSDKLGTSISTTLRVYSSEMREKRRMRAEEKAHRLPVLISIPLVVCMLPVMIGVLMLPATVRVVREILPIMSGAR